MKTSEILRSAGAELENNGWCKGQLEDDQGRHCLDGALYEVIDRLMMSDLDTRCRLLDDARHELRLRIPLRLRNGGHGITAFNDHKDTTYQDVLTVIDNAIADCEARGE